MRESHRRRGHLLGHYAVSHGRHFGGHLQINFSPIHFLICRRSLYMTIIIVSFLGYPALIFSLIRWLDATGLGLFFFFYRLLTRSSC